MKTIWKYELEITDIQTIEMPVNAKILCVRVHKNKPHLWVLLDPDNDKTAYIFRTIDTGECIEKTFNGLYIGTYQLMNGQYVGNLFQL